MPLEKGKQYVYRIGSDNQCRLYWNGEKWCYEYLAGGVLFDEQKVTTEQELSEAIGFHGLKIDQFSVDDSGDSEKYSHEIRTKMKKHTKAGLSPCSKHGLSAINEDNTCEACQNDQFPDDHRGTEGS